MAIIYNVFFSLGKCMVDKVPIIVVSARSQGLAESYGEGEPKSGECLLTLEWYSRMLTDRQAASKHMCEKEL